MSGLDGCVVANTRGGAPEDRLSRRLTAEGARVLAWPTISFEPSADPAALAAARRALRDRRYDWVVFTSARAVPPTLHGIEPVPATRVAAVGRTTARAVRDAGWSVDVVGEGDAVELARKMDEEYDLTDARGLFPAASRAGSGLEEILAGRGAEIERVEAYRTVLTPPDAARVRRDLASGVDVVAFASPSAVTSLARALAPEWPGALAGAGVAAIGPSTERTLVHQGIAADRIATAIPPGVEGMVEACRELIMRRRRS